MLIPRMPRQSGPRDAQLLQGTLDMLILKICALQPIHGYGIVQRLQQISRESLHIRQGSLYPALYRLEHRGLLGTRWGTSDNNRRAKYYRLTAKGQKRLREETESWNRLASAIAAALGARPQEG